MINFFDWVKECPDSIAKEWLVLGKGPSFRKAERFDLGTYNTISLNHVVKEMEVTISHAIDFEVAVDCQQEIAKNAKFLLLPWRPNVDNKPGEKILPELVKEHDFLIKLQKEGRLLWYHLKLVAYDSKDWQKVMRGKLKMGGRLMVPATFFSAEAAVNILAQAGINKIRTLGVDGGTTYSKNFDDIKDKTLLANGQKTFDIQFLSIARTIMEKNLDFAPLDAVETPIKVYVGSMPEQMLSVKVLEYSIRKNSSMSVEVIPLFKNDIQIPKPKDERNKPRTPFSFQRFLIPELKGHTGRAIYVDSDMQVFRDIRDLWERPMEGCDVLAAYESSDSGRKPQFAVMLLDCEQLQWDIAEVVKRLDSGELNYEKLMFEMGVAKKVCPVIEREWNSLEHYEEGKTALIHYTDMDKQPWLFTHNPNAPLWVAELSEAIKQKFISMDFLNEEIDKGNVRPSLAYQVKNRKFQSSEIPEKIKKLDRDFVPPHMGKKKLSGWKKFKSKLGI